jgi:aminopeptidase N
MEKGFHDYKPAASSLELFTGYRGPHPFQKLANVQSTTIFGGMENANTIFYDENSVNGKRTVEPTIAHEIAHQWFGDMATEKNFAHLWLSEGFANYLTNIYWETKYGKEETNKRLLQDKEKIIAFNRFNNRPVVDSVSDLMDLLNANSYQKGGWVLHMLRGEVGDGAFQKIIQQYYRQYKGSNADTRDFQRVAEKVAAKKLDWFFDQWLYKGGIPKINAEWSMQGSQVAITIKQTGKNVFQFPITVGYYNVEGKIQSTKLNVTKANETFLLPVNSKPTKMVLDPFVELLYDGSISESR